MASSNPLRPQNRSQQDQAGILKNQDLKTKPSASSFKRGSENLDPNGSVDAGKGVSKLKSISRLPVLAKSLQPVLSELSQSPSHNRWEQRPLTGKAQKKRACTKPVPFNLSQSRTRGQKNTDIPSGEMPLMPSTRLTPAEKARNLNPSAKTETSSHRPTTPGALRAQANKSQRLQSGGHVENIASNKNSTDDHPPQRESQYYSNADLSSRLGSITLIQSNLPQDSSLNHLCKTSLNKDKHCFQTALSTLQSHSSTKGEGSTAGVQCVMPRLSTCPPGPGISNNVPQRVMKKSHHGIDVTAAGTFSPDPSALRSILQSDGTRPGEHVGATPRASTCPTGRGTSVYSALRVPVKKSQKETPAETKSLIGNAFSSDPSVLRGILQNSGATPNAQTGLTGRATSIYSAQRVPVRKTQTADLAVVKAPAGSAVSFSPDPAALRSILLNEGVRAAGATPRASTCLTGRGTSVYSALRVPVKKSQKEAPAETKSPVGNAFSSDPSVLRGILQNSGATPNAQTGLTGRATSIYSAQRVPVRKTQTADLAVLNAPTGASRTPMMKMKWTPQRVANTRPQSMRKPCTTQKMSSLRGSPGLRGSNDQSTGLMCPEGEDVVQRLFEDQEQMEDEQIHQDDITSTNSHQTTEAQSSIKENSQSNHPENGSKPTTQPFIQAAHRGSVIVFSSSQRLERSQDTLGPTLGIGALLQPSKDQPTSHTALPDQSNGSQIQPSLDPTKQSQSKASTIMPSSAVSALRRRHTPLEEMFLDEECATYTSRLLSCPLQPRSGNPVATTLLFQDSTCFLPIGLSSPLRQSPVPSGSSIRA